VIEISEQNFLASLVLCIISVPRMLSFHCSAKAGQPRITACWENTRIGKEEQFASRKSSRSQGITWNKAKIRIICGVLERTKMATQAAGSQATDYTKSCGMTSFNGGSKRRGTLQRKFRLWIHFLGVIFPGSVLIFLDEWTIKTPNPIFRLFFKIDLLTIVFNRFYRLEIH
jgi:hypothetical protein